MYTTPCKEYKIYFTMFIRPVNLPSRTPKDKIFAQIVGLRSIIFRNSKRESCALIQGGVNIQFPFMFFKKTFDQYKP